MGGYNGNDPKFFIYLKRLFGIETIISFITKCCHVKLPEIIQNCCQAVALMHIYLKVYKNRASQILDFVKVEV